MTKLKFWYSRPTRAQLCGMSASEFKTLLRLNGFLVRRDFFQDSMCKRGNQFYRFRWWSEIPAVDICHDYEAFDRWANSVDETINLKEWLNK